MRFSIIQHGRQQYDLAVDLRDRILRQPLGLNFSAEQLAAESTDIHLAGLIDNQVGACCVVHKQDDDWFKVRQVAVDNQLQRQGYGKQLMEFVHQHVGSLGGKHVFCHSRTIAEPFYQRLGYRSVGEYFEEVTIQHVRMEKDL